MTTEPDDSGLGGLARRVADNERIDWDKELEQADGDVRRRAVEGLRKLANVAGAHQVAQDAPVGAGDESTLPLPGSSVETETVGPYRLLDKLGEGGMGVVWLAEQQEPIRRRVALKLIKLGMDTRQVIARFESERQALAIMDHPNVAKVFDANATEQGRPYFAMEYVRGEPITTYCDKHRLTTKERLRLFMQVCEGIQHAHQKGIIHRDIKPSNVLVTIHGQDPVPKIIDFGVAKATEQRLTERTVFTQHGTLIGTPEYMSPEQAEMTTLDIDTRTDVYSLGVLLYELLIGALPIDPAELLRAGYDEFRRRIREDEPSKPSTRLGTLGDASTESARRRQTDVKALRRQLSGDLDWITMRALEKDRTRRYGSPLELAADIGRHLRHEPVVASPPSTAYRAKKFLRRHKLGVATAAVLTLSLIAGTVATSLGLVRARRAAETAARVSAFLTQTLGTVQPDRMGSTLRQDLLERMGASAESRGLSTEEVAARLDALVGVNTTDVGVHLITEEILARAGGRIDEVFADDPLLAARLEHTLCDTYRSLGQDGVSERHCLRAVEIREQELGRNDPATLRSMNNLAIALNRLRRRDEAEALHLETLEARRRVLGHEHPDTLSSMHNLGWVYHVRSRHDDAEKLFVEVLEARRRVLGTEHPDTLSTMHNLALVYDLQGRGEESERLHLETLETRKRTLGDDHEDTLESMMMLALRYQRRGHDEAEGIYVEAIDKAERLLGDVHPTTRSALQNLVMLYKRHGRSEEARPYVVRQLAVQKYLAETSASAGASNVYAWNALTYEPADVRDPASALRFALIANEKTEYQNPSYLDTLSLAYHLSGNTVKAIEIQRKAIALVPEDDMRLRPTLLGHLADLYSSRGEVEKVRPLIAEQLALYKRRAEASGRAGHGNRYAWAVLTSGQADLRDPESALKFALAANEATGYKNPVYLNTLSLAYHLTGDTAKAIENQQKAITFLFDDDKVRRAEFQRQLSEFEAASADTETVPPR